MSSTVDSFFKFAAPAAFWLLGLLPVIVLMYLLKLRRTERMVSSTYLWQQIVQDIEANAPWQRLRRNLLLLLQIIFLILLILALARPTTPTADISSQSAIFILDTSASMAATDVIPNRLDVAKFLVRQAIDNLPASARITLITAGARASVVSANSLDREQTYQALKLLTPSATGSDLSIALQLASAIALRQPDTVITVVSDGGASLPERFNLQGTLRFLPIGQSRENQAITQLNLHTVPGGGTASAFAQVTNYGALPANRRLAFYTDGALFSAHDLTLPPGEEKIILEEGIFTTTQVLEARLLPIDPANSATLDFLPLDDQAFAIQRPPQVVQVNLLSPGNLFLETALSLLPGVKLTRLGITDAPNRATAPPADLTVIDGSLPVTATLPVGNLLWIGPLRSTELFSVTGVLTHPVPLAVNPLSPLLQNVSLATVNILDAARLSLPDWSQPVIVNQADRFPLLFTGQAAGRRLAVLAFDLRRSDLPLQVAFPILLANLVDWLAPGQSNLLPSQVIPGAAIQLYAPLGLSRDQLTAPVVKILRPDGTTVRLEVPSNNQGGMSAILYAETSQVGVYQLQWELGGEFSKDESFAVNLFAPQESQIAPVEFPSIPGQGGETTQVNAAEREWWRLLALLAIAILLLEWFVYFRANLAWLVHSLSSVVKRNANLTR